MNCRVDYMYGVSWVGGNRRSITLPSNLRIFLTSPYGCHIKYTACYNLAAFTSRLRVINVYFTGCYDVFTTNIYDLFRAVTDKYEHATTL